MSRSLGWVRQFHKPAQPLPLLLVFPHVGAGASAYRKFSETLSNHFEVLLFQYPGRQDRVREPAPATLPEFASGAFAEFRASTWAQPETAGAHRPLTLFGHSMGGLVAFEFARLAEAAGFGLSGLFASSVAAPWTHAEVPGHPTEDDALVAHLARLNGTDESVMQDREMMRMALPVIKADYAAADRYACGGDVRLRTWIHVFAGADDHSVRPEHFRAWAEHTEHELALTEFPGGHFFVDANLDAVARAVRSALLPQQVRA